MRLLCWNINGIRTLPQYHPWNGYKTYSALLDALEADIICFQEMKTSRAQLSPSVAIPPGYDSFFSFPVSRAGYSGVAVYSKSTVCRALDAEEGLTGNFGATFLSASSTTCPYPSAEDVELPEGITLRDLDSEGRVLVLDYGLFVLFNVYAPALTDEDRLPFKLAFHRLLRARVKSFLMTGREVLVVGDLNVCSAPLDSADGHLASVRDSWWDDRPDRAWLRDWMTQDGMVDVVRRFWPERKGMFTCWNTKILARQSNYGQRIDYILCSKGLLPWVKAADISPSLMGSDHCPVWVEFRDTPCYDENENLLLVGENLNVQLTGAEVTLEQSLAMDKERDVPKLAAKWWSEHRQKSVASFFSKKTDVKTTEKRALDADNEQKSMITLEETPFGLGAGETSASETLPLNVDASSKRRRIEDSASGGADDALPTGGSVSSPNPSALQSRQAPAILTITRSKSRTKVPESDYRNAKKKAPDPGQAKLSSFFARSSTVARVAESSQPPSQSSIGSTGGEADVIDLTDLDDSSALPPSSQTPSEIEEDYAFAVRLTQEADSEASLPCPSTSSGMERKKNDTKAWAALMTPIRAPNCTVHGEPAKLLTVTKQGPNKGRAFYICSRPVGPGYDKGREERRREEVDPRWRCNYFSWESDVRGRQ